MPSRTRSRTWAGSWLVIAHRGFVDVQRPDERSTCSPRRTCGCHRSSLISTFAQHLANDHLDVLIVDLHTLQPVNVLDFLDQVGWPALRHPSRRRISCGLGSPVGDASFTLANDAARPQTRSDVAPLGIRSPRAVSPCAIGDHQALLALGSPYQNSTMVPVCFREDRRFFRLASLEQISHTAADHR